MINELERIDIFGLKFSNTNIDDATEKIIAFDFATTKYICFPSTNSISKAYKNSFYQNILNNSFLTIPDGKFTEIYARNKGYRKIQTTSGYWIMRRLLKTKLTHYFYGCDEKVLQKLRRNIADEFPDAKILGFKSPPMVQLDEVKDNEIIKKDFNDINKLKPHLIWIGISAVKQEYLMHYFKDDLNSGLMLGVGAVFLYVAGTVKKGPEWVKKIGMRWLLRLLQEPKRLIKSTLPSILFFGYLWANEKVKKLFLESKKSGSSPN